MKQLIIIVLCTCTLLSCSNREDEKHQTEDNRIALHSDTLNVVKLTDQMVIYESTCRGCAYETSTSFGLSDTLDIVKLSDVITIDNHSPDMAGGNISKELVIVPVKTGATTIKLYKIWSQKSAAKDSLNYTSYKIEVRN